MDSVSEGSVDEVSDAEFRELMSLVCGPVVVVTTASGAEPEPAGTTISSFTSLSAEPMLVMLALDRTSRLLARVERAGRFGINILGVGQEDVAKRFATKRDDKFDGVPWHSCAGLPRLDGAAGWASAVTERLIPGGDHVIVVGGVRMVGSGTRLPLVYGGRTFGAHSELAPR